MTKARGSRLMLLIFTLLRACVAVPAAPLRRVSIPSMSTNAREILSEAMSLGDQAWDPETKCLHVVGSDKLPLSAGRQMVRETSWYALGLLMRDRPGDRERAAEALDAVLKQQYLDPRVKWYGTFRRSPEEPDPAGEALMWKDYDPNWRVFVGTTFELIPVTYSNRLPHGMAQRLYRSIDEALAGEKREGRLVPSYTNIALMYGALMDFAGARANDLRRQQEAAAWDRSVYRLFKQHNAFQEYNSPTYYGTDLYGLAMWRLYGSTAQIRSMGSEMEAVLWRDIADFYQPELRNLAGPYDRSYGMDMETYVAIVGVWMRSVMPADQAPLPRVEASTDHVADAWFAPPIVLLGARIPQDALHRLRHFAGPHLVKRQITAERSATAWIGNKVIYGGEATRGTKDAHGDSQFHPATMQWRTPSGGIGWVQVVHVPPVDAVADEHTLSISSAKGDVLIRIRARGADITLITKGEWKLPGLDVPVTTDATGFTLSRQGELMELTYTGMTAMRWSPLP